MIINKAIDSAGLSFPNAYYIDRFDKMPFYSFLTSEVQNSETQDF